MSILTNVAKSKPKPSPYIAILLTLNYPPQNISIGLLATDMNLKCRDTPHLEILHRDF